LGCWVEAVAEQEFVAGQGRIAGAPKGWGAGGLRWLALSLTEEQTASRQEFVPKALIVFVLGQVDGLEQGLGEVSKSGGGSGF
jgi:hypothetical protein